MRRTISDMSPSETGDLPSEDSKENLASPANNPARSETPTDPLEKMLQTLWVNSRQTIDERVESIRGVYTQARAGALDHATRQLGSQAAHKLAGVLGTFSLPRGSEIGRSIEELLEQSGKLLTADVSQLGEWVTELETVIASKSPTKP
jgi:HPt (histidine-containing phosphotransfer) domain-containing protein